MHEAIEAWASFYVIVGSSAAALTGLQFVVMTLISEAEASRGGKETISAFGTPNVVHFCSALLVASILSAPWSALRYAGVAVAGCGVLGVVYTAVVMRRARRQSGYEPVFEDWLWHTVLPGLAYFALFVAGVVVARSSVGALFVIGGATLLLVFIGIHNAWDTVTYVTVQRGMRKQEAEVRTGGGAEPRAGGDAGPAADLRAAGDEMVNTGTEAVRGSGPGST